MSVDKENQETAKTPREQAEQTIREWAEYLEINTEGEDFSELVETLVVPVVKGRLDFDKEEECFRYKLLKPITYQNQAPKEILEIRELDLGQKKAVQRFKDSEKIGMLGAIYAKSAGLALGEADQLKGRDVTVITALVTDFFS